MIEIINEPYIQAQLDRLKEYCQLCKWQGSKICGYCGLGRKYEVCWEEKKEDLHAGIREIRSYDSTGSGVRDI